MISEIIGETAAILTSCLWTFNSILFTSAGKRIGSFSVNAYRIVIAVGLLAITHSLLLGTLFPVATNEHLLWIGLSGIVGLGIGDFGLFAAFVLIGPRRSVLVMALSPIFASITAYLMLAEIIPSLATIGIATTLTGVTAVILEKKESSEEEATSKRQKIWGVSLALVGAVGQGIGLVFAKKGIYLDPNSMLNPLSAALIRMTLGAVFVWICALITGKLKELHKALKNRRGIKYTAAGAFIGPFMGVTLSMVAVAYTEAGTAQTLMSLMPVLIIPVVWVLYGQRTSLRGILGAIVAVIGVAILFLS
ncbi:MAG: DMT family transporter [Candidatus Bathyarchaeia archaeon]